MTRFSDKQDAIKTFASLIHDGAKPETAITQVAFEQGVTPEEMRRVLEIHLGDLTVFVLNESGRATNQ